MSINLGPSNLADVPAMVALVNHYADVGITLPRTVESVRTTLDDWVIAQETEYDQAPCGAVDLVGCGALVPLTDELVEIRSLAIAKGQQGKGIGRLLVNELVAMARDRGFAQVCALTLTENFFTGLGFHLVDRWSISPKIWQACIYCPKFHRCDEVAVLMDLHQPQHDAALEPLAQAEPQPWNGLLKWHEWQPLRLAYRHKVGHR